MSLSWQMSLVSCWTHTCCWACPKKLLWSHQKQCFLMKNAARRKKAHLNERKAGTVERWLEEQKSLISETRVIGKSRVEGQTWRLDQACDISRVTVCPAWHTRKLFSNLFKPAPISVTASLWEVNRGGSWVIKSRGEKISLTWVTVDRKGVQERSGATHRSMGGPQAGPLPGRCAAGTDGLTLLWFCFRKCEVGKGTGSAITARSQLLPRLDRITFAALHWGLLFLKTCIKGERQVSEMLVDKVVWRFPFMLACGAQGAEQHESEIGMFTASSRTLGPHANVFFSFFR